MKRLKLKKPEKNTKYYLKKAAVSAVGVVAATSMLIGGVFSSPKDVTAPLPDTPPAIMEVYEADTVPDDEESSPVRRKSLKQRVREKLLAWPQWLRAILLLPLWGLGTVLSLLLRTFLPGFLKWLLGALFPLLLLLAGLKLLFPEIPLSKLLCRKNRIALAILAVLLFITSPILEHFYPDKTYLAFCVKLGLLALTFLIACVQILIKRRPEEPEKA